MSERRKGPPPSMAMFFVGRPSMMRAIVCTVFSDVRTWRKVCSKREAFSGDRSETWVVDMVVGIFYEER
jgi:hypothetical protein